MPARRFFVRDAHHAGEVVAVHGSDAHKIVNVLRLRDGDVIEVVDSAGSLFAATLETKDGRWPRALAKRARRRRPPGSRSTSRKVFRRAEDGLCRREIRRARRVTLIPLQSERTIVQDLGAAKLERWRRLARSSAQQSGRTDLLAVTDPLPFAQLCVQFSEYDAVLFPWEVAEPQSLREHLPAIIRDARRKLVVIGPEGGFSHGEAESAQAAGAHLLSLGPRILRTETAALAVVAVLGYELGT